MDMGNKFEMIKINNINFLSSICNTSDVLKVIYFILQLLKIISILVPILLILMVIVDFSKNVIAGAEDVFKKNFQLALKRILMAVGFFLVPTIVSFIVNILGNLGVDYMACIQNATPSQIKVFEQQENAIKEQETTNEETTTSTDLSGGSYKPTTTTSDEENNSNLKTTVDFTNFEKCNQNTSLKTVQDSKGNKYKLYNCIKDYQLYNLTKKTNKLTMQNIAITSRYVYFSYTGRGAWVNDSYKSSNGEKASLKKVSAHYIIRISKSNNNYQISYLEYAGHTQSFDVTSEDKIYLNYFAKLYKGSIGNGSKYVGLTWVDFKSNTKEKGEEIIPKTAIYVSKNGKKFTTFSSKEYLTNGTVTDEYYNKVIKIGKNSSNMTNPEVAVDEKNDRIALVSGSSAYIYNLSDLKQGKANLINNFQVSSSKQGVELSNGYLYHWNGNKSFSLKKYNISTGKLVNQINFSLTNVGEAEGISIYNGNVYLGIAASDKSNQIYLIENF